MPAEIRRIIGEAADQAKPDTDPVTPGQVAPISVVDPESGRPAVLIVSCASDKEFSDVKLIPVPSDLAERRRREQPSAREDPPAIGGMLISTLIHDTELWPGGEPASFTAKRDGEMVEIVIEHVA